MDGYDEGLRDGKDVATTGAGAMDGKDDGLRDGPKLGGSMILLHTMYKYTFSITFLAPEKNGIFMSSHSFPLASGLLSPKNWSQVSMANLWYSFAAAAISSSPP